MQTERGRWFLQEYARRNRSADTQLLLAAIQRIEAVVGAERSRQAQQGFRTDLLEMAKAITRTRAEVAEIRSDAGLRPQSASPREPSPLPPPPQARDVFAAAERIRDVTWAMRGHGFDPTTCDQLEELAASILAATSLRDPTDRRASKLSEVLQYLEHRIDALLESSAEGDAASPEPAPEPPGAEAEPATAFAGPTATADGEHGTAEPEAGLASPPSLTDFHIDLSAAHDDLEGDPAAESPPQVELALQEAAFPPPPPDQGVDPAIELRDPAATGEHHDILLLPAPDPTDAEPSQQSSEGAQEQPGPPIDDLEGDAVAEPPAVAIALQEASPPPPDLSVDPAIELLDAASALGEYDDIPAGLPTADAEPSRPSGEADETQPEPVISARSQDVASQTAEITRSGHSSADDLEPPSISGFIEHIAAEPLAAPALEAELGSAAGSAVASSPEFDSAAAGDVAAPAEPPAPKPEATKPEATKPEATADEAQSLPPIEEEAAAVGPPAGGAFLPAVEMTESMPFLRRSPEVQPVAAAPREQPAFLPEVHLRLELPGLAPAAPTPQTFAAPAEPARPEIHLATGFDEGQPEPAGLQAAPVASEPSSSPAGPQPATAEAGSPIESTYAAAAETPAPRRAAAPVPQAPGGDPLAALKAMSDDELTALFS